jgi:hypothetical protein
MKKITLLLSFIACIVFAHAQLLVNENFDYTANSALIGQGGWAIVGTSVINPLTVSAPGTTAITYTNYPSSGVGNEVSVANNGQDIARQFAAQTSGVVYYSVLVNISAAQVAGDYFIHIGEPTSASFFFGRLYVKIDGTGTKLLFGILNASGGTPTPVATYSTTTYDLNTTILLVVKVDVLTGASSLVINPDMTVEPVSSSWISSSAGTGVPTVAGLGEVNIRQGSATAAPTLKLDGIRVATSYQTLFPNTVSGISSPNANNVLNVSLSGKRLSVMNVTNGTTVAIYSALGSKVQSSKLENGAIQLNDFSKGLYIVRVGNQSTKIII